MFCVALVYLNIPLASIAGLSASVILSADTTDVRPFTLYVTLGIILFALILVGNANTLLLHAIFDNIENPQLRINGIKDNEKVYTQENVINLEHESLLRIYVNELIGYRKSTNVLWSFINTLEYWLFSLPLRAALYSAFFACGLHFLLDGVWLQNSEPWFTSRMSFPSSINIAGFTFGSMCDLVENVVIDSMKVFYALTNNIILIDIMMTLDGVYLDVLMYRMRGRQFLANVYPVLQNICAGDPTTSTFANSILAPIFTVVFGFILALIPFSLFRDAKHAFEYIVFWLALLVLIIGIAFAMLLIADVSTIFLGLVTNTYVRTNTSHGNYSTQLLVAMACAALVLCIPPSYHHEQIEFLNHKVRRLRPRSIKAFFEIFARMLTSSGVLLGMGALVIAYIAGQEGLPLTSITLSKVVNGTQLYPDFANFNGFELAVTQATSAETLVRYSIGNLTLMNLHMAESLFDYLPSFTTPNVCSPEGDCSYTVNIGTLIDAGFADLTPYILQGENLAIDFIFSAINDVGGLLSKFDAALLPIVQFIGIELLDILSFLDEVGDLLIIILNTLKQILGTAYDLLVYLPAVVVLAFLIVAIFGLFLPKVATLLYLSMLLSIFLLIASFAAAILLVKQAVFTLFQYNVNFIWNYPVLVLDICVVVLLLASSLMLFTLDLETKNESKWNTSKAIVYEDDLIEEKELAKDSGTEEEHKPLIEPITTKGQVGLQFRKKILFRVTQ